MSSPVYDGTRWLSPTERALLAEAVAITNARNEHVSPDMCERCDGVGCDQCMHCDCPTCQRYIPPMIQASIRRWRP